MEGEEGEEGGRYGKASERLSAIKAFGEGRHGRWDKTLKV